MAYGACDRVTRKGMRAYRIGAGEPMTLRAAIAKATELGSIVLAMMLLGR